MPQSRQILFIGLFIFTLLVTTCQSQPDEAIGDEQQPPGGETSMSQVVAATTTSPPTAMPLPTFTSLPTSTSSPTATPFPTSPLLPTPTAIPADAPTPTAINTSAPASVSVSSPNEVDLVTLEETLALLDRVERRNVEPTKSSIGPTIYEGRVSSYVPLTEGCTCRSCATQKFSAELSLDVDGNVSGIFRYGAFQRPVVEFTDNKVEVPFTGTQDSVTGRQDFHANGDYERLCTGTLQAKLTDNGGIFEGTIEETCVQESGHNWCEGLWTFSLPRK